ncbi:hypothetical protein [Blastococcus sp. SYSU D00813]
MTEGFRAKVRREETPIPVWVEAGGEWHPGYVNGWVKGSGEKEWRASVSWSQPREDGTGHGNHLGTRTVQQLRPRETS